MTWRNITAVLLIGAAAGMFLMVRRAVTPAHAGPTTPAAPAQTEPSIERGKYLIRVGGCNDCHTPGFMERGMDVPESDWLIGVPLGWQGPWGTTYASNLRLFAKDFDEQTWVAVLRARTTRPPMPWPNLHAMTDQDLRSVFRYIRSLPVTGQKMPEYLPPGEQPRTPYIVMMPQMPAGQAAAAAAR